MIYITKTGFRKNEWDKHIRQYCNVPIDNILHEIRGACEVEEGVTLGNIFSAMEKEEGLCFLIGWWAWCDCATFHKEVKKLAAIPSSLKWIELSQHIEISEDGGVSINFDVHGRDGSDTSWGIDFTPVNELRDVPFQLDKETWLTDFRSNPCKQETLKAGTFSLLEVLGELYYEVSFHGSPSDRNEKLGEVMDSMVEAKAAIEDGTAVLRPWPPPSDRKIQ